MDQRAFWKIIDEFVSEDKMDAPYFHAELAERLSEMSPKEMIEFATTMREELNTAFTWDLVGASSLITGGVTDEGFDAFCGWLMAQGSDVFRQAVHHPDSLADYLRNYEGDDVFEDDELIAAPLSAYEEKTGDIDSFELKVSRPPLPEGEQWDVEDASEQEARLPELYAYYMAEDDRDPEEEGEDDYL